MGCVAFCGGVADTTVSTCKVWWMNRRRKSALSSRYVYSTCYSCAVEFGMGVKIIMRRCFFGVRFCAGSELEMSF